MAIWDDIGSRVGSYFGNLGTDIAETIFPTGDTFGDKALNYLKHFVNWPAHLLGFDGLEYNTSSASSVPDSVNTSSASTMQGDLDFSDAGDDLNDVGSDSLAYQLEQQRKYNEDQATLAYERQKEFRRTHYKDLVEGMKEAGLNPMLLSHVGYSGSTVPQASSQAVGGDTWSDLVSASANKHNSYSSRLTAIASLIGASASVLDAIAEFVPNINISSVSYPNGR